MNRKFKIKNRQKRKYIKKNSPISSISLSRSYFIRFMPYSIIIIGLLTTFFAGTRPFQPQPIDLTINRPTFSFTNLHAIATDFLNFVTILQTVTQDLLRYCASLIILLGHGIAIILQGIATITHTIGAGLIAILSAIEELIYQIFSFFVSFLTFVFNALSRVGLALWNHTISFTSFILSEVEGLISLIWYILMTPLRAIGAFFLMVKPYLDYIGNNLKDSIQFLQMGNDTLRDITK
jgi:hypothetical protein